MQTDDIYKLVQARYGELAGRTSAAESKEYEESIARSFGYEASELSSLPQDANLGVSCGNPLAVANLREVGCTGVTDP
jgi:arsenite methyltransferase